MKTAIAALIVVLLCSAPLLLLRSQPSRQELEIIELKRQIAANRKSIDENLLSQTTSDATKIKFLDLILTNLPAILTAFGTALLVVWQAKRKEDSSVARNATLVAKTDDLVKQTGVIHELANSNLSKITMELQVSRKETEGLRMLVESMVKDKEKAPTPIVVVPVQALQPLSQPIPLPASVPSVPSAIQSDRIEQTGQDTNERAQNIETHVVQRVEKVEEKLEEKKDK